MDNFYFKNLFKELAFRVFSVFDYCRHHPLRGLEKIAFGSSVEYISKNMPDAVGMRSGREIIKFAVSEAKEDGEWLEFGVYRGGSIRYIAALAKEKIIHGFDTFYGLPEKWGGTAYAKNAFDTNGRLPRVPKNVTLHKGAFDKTLPEWLAGKSSKLKISFLYIDCDIYSSTRTIFEHLGSFIQQGTCIVFDEYFNYPNWHNHEFKAFSEFVKRAGISYEYLAYAKEQVVVRITQVDNH